MSSRGHSKPRNRGLQPRGRLTSSSGTGEALPALSCVRRHQTGSGHPWRASCQGRSSYPGTSGSWLLSPVQERLSAKDRDSTGVRRWLSLLRPSHETGKSFPRSWESRTRGDWSSQPDPARSGQFSPAPRWNRPHHHREGSCQVSTLQPERTRPPPPPPGDGKGFPWLRMTTPAPATLCPCSKRRLLPGRALLGGRRNRQRGHVRAATAGAACQPALLRPRTRFRWRHPASGATAGSRDALGT